MNGRTPSASAACCLLAMAGAGCTLYDPSLEISNLGALPADAVLEVQVRASAHIDQVALDLDGRRVGRFPTRQDLALDVSSLDEGMHTLTATAGGGHPPPPATLAFEVGRGPTATLPPALVDVQPPAGGVVAPSPFEVVLAFSKRLDPWYVTTQQIGSRNSGGPLPTMLSLAPDGRSVTLALGLPLEAAGSVSVQAQVRDLGGRSASFISGSWFAWEARVSFDAPAGDVLTNGPVTIAPRAEAVGTASSAISGARLYAGDVLVATLGPLPWAPVTWDTRTVPDGRYPLTLDVDGFKEVLDQTPPAVIVDHTGPTVTCQPQYSAPDQVALRETIVVSASEPATGDPVLLVDGVPHPTSGYWSGSTAWLRLAEPLPTPPFTLGVELTGLRDAAGNPAVVAGGCAFDVPFWLAPWGAGPMTQSGAVVRAAEIGLGYDFAETLYTFPRQEATLWWIPPPGQPGQGSVFVSTAVSPGPWSPPALRSLQGTTASELVAGGGGVWTQRSGSLPGQVVFATASLTDAFGPQPVVLNLDPLRGAHNPARSGGLAWSEIDDNGVWVIRGKSWDPWGWHDRDLDARADPSASADSPSLGNLLAFLETAPGGVPQVRAARVVFGVEPFPGSLNLDPTVAASEPAALGGGPTAVAWVENGRLLVRIAEDPTLSLTFGPATVLNVDPVRPARSPLAVTDAVFFFVEQGANGDGLWARRWDGTEWRLLPGPVNAQTPGPIQSIAATSSSSAPPPPLSPRAAVAWVDASGEVRLRVANW